MVQEPHLAYYQFPSTTMRSYMENTGKAVVVGRSVGVGRGLPSLVGSFSTL